MWCIPSEQNAAFVCQMEQVLDVYQRGVDPAYPVVCMDESSYQCTREVRDPIPAKQGQTERYDAEYKRNGVAHLLLFHSPFDNWRRVDVADNHKAIQWAQGIRKLVQEDFPHAHRITLVMDNLNTHTGASLYKAFSPDLAHSILEKLEFIYTPKHGSWLNIAECEFSVLSRQCLSRRLPDIETVNEQIQSWSSQRNQLNQPLDWQFTTADARIKLKRLYPNILDG